jgi:hypothetical protein
MISDAKQRNVYHNIDVDLEEDELMEILKSP